MSIKILTVDDSKTIRLIVAKAFKPYDCRCQRHNTCRGQPGKAGRDFIDYAPCPSWMARRPESGIPLRSCVVTTPVIMLTAEAGRDTVIKIAKLGVRDYLIKPFKGELLIERVGRVVSLKSKTDAVEKLRRFDDPISILVVDDKPAIAGQIRTALADTPWKITSNT